LHSKLDVCAGKLLKQEKCPLHKWDCLSRIMNFRPILTCLAIALSATAYAQDAPSIKVRVTDLKSAPVQTPQFQISNIPAKPYRPKTWLEIDVTFDAEKTQKALAESGPFVDGLEFKYYVALNKQRGTPAKTILLTGTINYSNIAVREKSHALAFVSPASLSRLLDKTDFTAGDIKAVGVEVTAGGQATGGGKSTMAGKFWENLSAFDVVDGLILPKFKTPFAPAWGDYDVEVKP
jgi:hypothetical protein